MIVYRKLPPSSSLPLLVSNRCEQVSAGLLATAADLDADPAVLVVGGVLLALLGAGPAGYRAGLDLRTEEAEIRLGLPDEDATSDLTGVGAVQAEANAADHLLHIRFGEVGVGVTRARRRALDAVLDAAQKQVTIKRVGPWVCGENLSNCHLLSLPSTGCVGLVNRRQSWALRVAGCVSH